MTTRYDVTRVILRFAGSPSALVRIEVIEGNGAHKISTRGAGFSRDRGSFVWSSSAKALVELLIRHRVFDQLAPESELTGDVGTAAASLDYAISKAPQWLLELFGSDEDGVCNFRRLVVRENPERKRSGPVRIRVRNEKLPRSSIEVIENGQRVSQDDALRVLLGRLLSSTSSRRSSQRKQVSYTEARTEVSPISPLSTELRGELSATSIFSPSAHRDFLTKLFRNSLFPEIDSRPLLFPKLEMEFAPSFLFGFGAQHEEIRRGLDLGRPLRILVPKNFAAARAIAHELTLQFPGTFEIDSRHEVIMLALDAIASGDLPVDLCFVPQGCAYNRALRSGEGAFRPLMPGPSPTIYAATRKEETARRYKKKHIFVQPRSTTELFYEHQIANHSFESYERSELQPIFSKEGVKRAIANLEPGDLLPLWSPFSDVAATFDSVSVQALPIPHDPLWTSLIVLRNYLYELPRLPVLLSIAIRRCWIDLLERDTIHARNHALMIQSGALTRGRTSGDRSRLLRGRPNQKNS